MQTKQWIAATAMVVFLSACGGSAKDDKGDLSAKKAELEKLKTEQRAISGQIAKLEQEIITLDPSAARQEKAKLVSITPLEKQTFTHYIDLQGNIDTDDRGVVFPRGMGGVVKKVFVKQGDYVKKGQLLLKLDDELARKQVAQLETQLAYAQDIYKRQQNLWNQNIGTEVQVLTAKNNVDQLEKQISQANEQLSYSNVYAEMSGVAESVTIREGEMFSPTSATQLGITIVNTSNLKVVVQVPENYLGRVGVGSMIEVRLPELNKTLTTKVKVAGTVIDPSSRTFYVEAPVPGGNLRPNQIALIRIRDYSSDNAIKIPVNTLQNDEQGKYVLVAAREGEKTVARKKRVVIGELYGNDLEVKSGLEAGDQLITDGFQGLYEGQLITTAVK